MVTLLSIVYMHMYAIIINKLKIFPLVKNSLVWACSNLQENLLVHTKLFK